jgi:hypothetical protein
VSRERAVRVMNRIKNDLAGPRYVKTKRNDKAEVGYFDHWGATERGNYDHDVRDIATADSEARRN